MCWFSPIPRPRNFSDLSLDSSQISNKISELCFVMFLWKRIHQTIIVSQDLWRTYTEKFWSQTQAGPCMERVWNLCPGSSTSITTYARTFSRFRPEALTTLTPITLTQLFWPIPVISLECGLLPPLLEFESWKLYFKIVVNKLSEFCKFLPNYCEHLIGRLAWSEENFWACQFCNKRYFIRFSMGLVFWELLSIVYLRSSWVHLIASDAIFLMTSASGSIWTLTASGLHQDNLEWRN